MKFNQHTVNAIFEDLKNEIPYLHACESNGVSYDTFRTWILNGKRDLNLGKSSYYTQFLESLRAIEKERIKVHLNNIKSEQKSHKGSEWVLERCFWKYFSDKAADIDLNERLEKLESKNR